jgi:hypothetical protein
MIEISAFKKDKRKNQRNFFMILEELDKASSPGC